MVSNTAISTDAAGGNAASRHPETMTSQPGCAANMGLPGSHPIASDENRRRCVAQVAGVRRRQWQKLNCADALNAISSSAIAAANYAGSLACFP